MPARSDWTSETMRTLTYLACAAFVALGLTPPANAEIPLGVECAGMQDPGLGGVVGATATLGVRTFNAGCGATAASANNAIAAANAVAGYVPPGYLPPYQPPSCCTPVETPPTPDLQEAQTVVHDQVVGQVGLACALMLGPGSPCAAIVDTPDEPAGECLVTIVPLGGVVGQVRNYAMASCARGDQAVDYGTDYAEEVAAYDPCCIPTPTPDTRWVRELVRDAPAIVDEAAQNQKDIAVWAALEICDAATDYALGEDCVQAT